MAVQVKRVSKHRTLFMLLTFVIAILSMVGLALAGLVGLGIFPLVISLCYFCYFEDSRHKCTNCGQIIEDYKPHVQDPEEKTKD